MQNVEEAVLGPEYFPDDVQRFLLFASFMCLPFSFILSFCLLFSSLFIVSPLSLIPNSAASPLSRFPLLSSSFIFLFLIFVALPSHTHPQRGRKAGRLLRRSWHRDRTGISGLSHDNLQGGGDLIIKVGREPAQLNSILRVLQVGY